MAVRLQRPGLVSSSSSSKPCMPRMSIVTFISCKKTVHLEYLSNCLSNPRSQLFVRYGFLERSKIFLNKKSQRLVLASAEDGVAINGSPKPRSNSNLGDMRTIFTGLLQDENSSNGLIQSLHDAARSIELAVKEKITPSRFSWFPATWLGADKYAWVKTLSYQASLYSLLQAVNEISSRGNYRDEDINVFVQRRSTQSILAANGFDSLENPLEDLVRHLIGGSVLYYPQLSAISSYQLYVEVACEELEWIPFYPDNTGTQPPKQSHGHKSKTEGPPNYEVIPQLLDVCSYWLQSFIKYSKWPENPSNVKAAKFLSKGHKTLIRCKEELGILKNASTIVRESNSFDKALESVDEALVRLESLLQELYVSNSSSGKEQIKAACSDLEKIRKLKKEAEFLEATFRAKAASLQQGGDKNDSQESYEVQKRYFKGKDTKNAISSEDQGKSISRGFWGFFVRPPRKKLDPEISGGEYIGKPSGNLLSIDSESNEISRFEILRNELIELEKRVKRSTDQSVDKEEIISEDTPQASSRTESVQLVQTPMKENIIEKTLQKLREASTDVWQGTQLLAIDSAAAVQLLRRSLIGDELTEKEKKALRRTMTDLASVIPIGILMLLPVTAVGHAAMLAGIQRYVPGLIPSTYGSERLNLLRQLEKIKELQTNETETEEGVEEIAL
ncbi:LETM1-like [Arabidopsis suecica]|uniref:LETM1-like n=1 Tax=Arabidopsis suecica TaxID=45249 RepID=A0A8T2B4S8_ARASU|nr:LETM1-like [Arabidopsis suecica]